VIPEAGRATVGVAPNGSRGRFARLFDALEGEWPVRFADAAPADTRGLAGLIGVGVARREVSGAIATLLVGNPSSSAPGDPVDVATHAHPELDAALRGHVLPEDSLELGSQAATADDDESVVASAGELAVWTWAQAGGGVHRVSAPLPALGPDGSLREHLGVGRFLAASALIHFLRALAGDRGWRLPEPRAAFLFDDPNLHAPSYGHIRYRTLARAGREHGYHTAMATIPADAWYVNREAGRIFREHGDVLSLLIHGNDHVRAELARPRSVAEANALARQAVRRIETLERRAGVSVARIMAPPHGRASDRTLRALRDAGLDAACISRPFPWLTSPPADRPLVSMFPAEIVADGFPVLPRYSLSAPRAEVPFKLFLGQPVILYGHHGDVADGLEPLADARADVARCGAARWMSLADIALSNFTSRQSGDELALRPFARRLRVSIPPGTRSIRLAGAGDGWRGDEVVTWQLPSGVRRSGLDAAVEVDGAAEVAVRIAGGSVEPEDGDAARRLPNPWPRARRLLTESRDRVAPLRRRLHDPTRATGEQRSGAR
jgi:hypothetical protein